MDEPNEIVEELKGICPYLATIEKINVFSIPENYFNGLEERISVYAFLNQKNSESVNKNDIHRVPEGYFDSLSNQILAKIKNEENNAAHEEIHILSPLLFSLKDKNVFTVPSGYFDNVSDYVIDKLTHKSAKVVSIYKAKSWWKYVAAAIITGASVIFSIRFFNSSPDKWKSNSLVSELNGLPEYIQSSFQYKTAKQVDEGIASLSDDVIIKYLEKHGNIMDNAALSNAVITKGLPSETDYLTNSNTLNNYLNTLSGQNANEKSQ